MIIEVTGARFNNKGAQLMLATVCERVREVFPYAYITMPMSYDEFDKRSQYGLYFTVRPPRHWLSPRRLTWDIISTVVGTTRVANAYGVVREQDLDAIIDISGYAFGDKWPAKTPDRLAQPALRLKARDKPVVMLPQMLGPFTKDGQAAAFKNLAQYVDRVYARDSDSFGHAMPLVNSATLQQAPDITILASSAPGEGGNRAYACLVPNVKLTETNPHRASWGDEYLNRLVSSGRRLQQHGLEIVVVQHDYGAGDSRLVDALQLQLGDKCRVVRHEDPKVLKSVLGAAVGVIGSRYHALLGALSKGVPVIALGWAHKYDMLLREYGIPEMIHNADDSETELLDMVDCLILDRGRMTRVIDHNQHLLSRRVEAMWDDVFSILASGK